MPKVLLTDDNAEMLETLERIFDFYDFEVEKAVNGEQAVKMAEETQPDLILLDGAMPVMDGFEACKILKTRKETRHIPIVFLTANYVSPKDRIAGLELGADDYLLKPFNSKELVMRSKAILKRNDMLHRLKDDNQRLAEKNKKIQQELKSLLEQSKNIDKNSFLDQVTGLYNQVYFNRRIKEEFSRAVRHKTPLSIIIVNVNNLEKVNESLGTQIGSYVIMKMANHLLNKTRISDVLSRADDGRFYIILPHTDAQGAFLEAERIRVILAGVNFIEDDLLETIKYPKRKISEFENLSVNLGVASFPDEMQYITDDRKLLSSALDALMRATRSGTDKTFAYNKMNQPSV